MSALLSCLSRDQGLKTAWWVGWNTALVQEDKRRRNPARRQSFALAARTAAGAFGLAAGGMALGWLPVLLLNGGRLVVAADSGSFNLFALAFLVGAVPGAAAGACAANKALGLKVSFPASTVGGLAGLTGGALLEVLYWVAFNALDPSLDGRLVWTMSAAAIYVPVWAGAVIGSGWKAGTFG